MMPIEKIMKAMPDDVEKFDSSKYSINASPEYVLGNIKTNIKRHLPQVQPHLVYGKDVEVALIGGGPSLKEDMSLVAGYHDAGVKLISTNGTFDYLLDYGLQPSAMVLLDSRPFNTRFVLRASEAPDCKFLISSQCHPDVFDSLEAQGAKVIIWHALAKIGEKEVLERYYYGKENQNYFPVFGGSTVILRSIWMMRMLGYTRQHIFGFDSCLMGDEHHSYTQVENDIHEISNLYVAGRQFRCSSWMASQAEDFMAFVKRFGDLFELQVHGDGLISYLIETGAELQREKEENNGSGGMGNL